MDEQAVREHADAHAAANVNGDMKRAAADLTDEARANIEPVARKLPRPMTAGRVVAVEVSDDERYLVTIEYSGPDGSATVESVWIDQGGRPMIAETRII